MHQPMHPVKVRIMYKKHQNNGKPVINNPICADVPVQIGIREYSPKDNSGHRSKNQYSKQRIQDISSVVG